MTSPFYFTFLPVLIAVKPLLYSTSILLFKFSLPSIPEPHFLSSCQGSLPTSCSPAMSPIKIVSLNANGLNNPTKQRAIFYHLRRAKADIYLLQETHATDNSAALWSQEWGEQITSNNGTQSSKGVMILYDRNLTFKIACKWQDDDGRLLCVGLDIGGTMYSIANIYAPT